MLERGASPLLNTRIEGERGIIKGLKGTKSLLKISSPSSSRRVKERRSLSYKIYSPSPY
jgi:hypothetical protein